MPRVLPRAGVLVNIEVVERDTGAVPTAGGDSADRVLFRSRLMLVPASWLVLELVAHVSTLCAEMARSAWKVLVLPRNVVCNNNAPLSFYNVLPVELLRIARRTDVDPLSPRVAVTQSAALSTTTPATTPASAIGAGVKESVRAPLHAAPLAPWLPSSASLRAACAALCGSVRGASSVRACDRVYVVDDVHHRRLLGVVTADALLRYVVLGAARSPLTPMNSRQSFVVAAHVDTRVATRSTGGASARYAADAARTRGATTATSGAALADLERAVHIKRNQSFVRKLTRRKLDVVDRSVVAPLFGVDPARVAMRERQGVSTFVERAVRYLTQHADTPHLFGTREREASDIASTRDMLSKRDADAPSPVEQGDVANLRAFAEKGALTVDLDVTSDFRVSPGIVASALRQLLLELPEPLTSYAQYDALLALVDNAAGTAARMVGIRAPLVAAGSVSSGAYAALLRVLLELLRRVRAAGAPGNDSGALAAAFAAAFARPPKPSKPVEGAVAPRKDEPAWVHTLAAFDLAGQVVLRGTC
jgi:hypothetical protein